MDPAPLHERRVDVGVISDTHSELDERVLLIFSGVDHIVHAGDVGDLRVLERLASVAPVIAVAGNTDSHDITMALPRVQRASLGGIRFLVVHKPSHVARMFEPTEPDGAVVVTGHTHVPKIEERHGTLHVNPGSASRPISGGQPTVALVTIESGHVHARVVPL